MDYVKLGADRIWYGPQALNAFSDLAGQRVFLVECGDINLQLGFRDTVTNILDRIGCPWEVFNQVEPEPCFDTIARGAHQLRRFAPDWIIGFGGGSAMDAAKAMWVFYENAVDSCAQLQENGGIRQLGNKAHLMCIPTSSGTGSEMTKAAIIKDNRTHRKYPIVDPQGRLIPSVAVLYPPFTATMPPDVTAACGMDAVTHAVEAFVSKSANHFSDAMAEGAFRLAVNNLARACAQGTAMDARQAMLEAACMAGCAFTNSSLGLAHAVAHAIGGYTSLPHGLINAVVLPQTVEFNSALPDTAAKYRALAGSVGADDLVGFLMALNKEIGIPASLREPMGGLEWTQETWDALIQAALDDVNLLGNPRQVDRAQMRVLMERVYAGV